MSLLQIYQWVCQWKNFENRLTFREVMGKSLVSCFFWDTVYICSVYLVIICHMATMQELDVCHDVMLSRAIIKFWFCVGEPVLRKFGILLSCDWIAGLLKDEVNVCVLSFLQCFDAICWLIGKTPSLLKDCTIYSTRFSSKQQLTATSSLTLLVGHQ